MKFEATSSTPERKMQNYPMFAEKFLGHELLQNLDEFIQSTRDFDILIDSDDNEATVGLFLETQDMQEVYAQVIDMGHKLIARALKRTKHRQDPKKRASHALSEILISQMTSGGHITRQLCEGLATFIENTLTLKMVLDIMPNEYMEVMSLSYTIHKKDPNDSRARLLRSWASVHSVLQNFKANLPEDFQPEIDLTQEQIDELSYELIEYNTLIPLPPLVMEGLFKNTPMEDYLLSFNGVQGLGQKHILGVAPATMHIVQNKDIEKSSLSDYSINRDDTSEGELDFWGFSGRNSTTIMFNYNGAAAYIDAHSFAPIRALPFDPDDAETLRKIQSIFLLKLREIYKHIFESINKSEATVTWGNQTVIPVIPGVSPLQKKEPPRTEIKPSKEKLTEETAIPDDTEPKIVLSQAPEVLKQIVKKETKKKQLKIPPVNSKRFVSALLKLGCSISRQNGRHMMIRGPKGNQQPIPNTGKKDLKKGTMYSIVEKLQLPHDALIKML